MTLVVWNK